MLPNLKVVINADDFGADDMINRAIIQAFTLGVISSTTIMANGQAFGAACQLAHEHRLTHAIGVHINLNDGEPLTDGLKKCSRFCSEEGRMDPNKPIRWPRLNYTERQAVIQEVKAQIERCRKQGLSLTHADSHCHIHTKWWLAPLLMDILKDEKIGYMRISRNMGSNIDGTKKVYKELFNRMVEWKGLRGVNYFTEIGDFVNWFSMPAASFQGRMEMMCHPTMDESGQLGNFYEDNLVDQYQRLKELVPHLSLVSYSQL